MADGPSAHILLHSPLLDHVFVIDRRAKRLQSKALKFFEWIKFILAIRREKFDTIIDLYSGPRSAFLAWFSRAPDRYGEDVRSRIRGFLYNHPIPITRSQRHLIEQKFDLVQPLVGKIDVLQSQLDLYISEEETQQAHLLLSEIDVTSGRIIGLVPGAGSPWRMWPSTRFAELADKLQKKYHATIILVGGEHDRVVCQEIREQMTVHPLDLSGRTSLRELMAVLGEMDLVISNVTGPMHIASALTKPKVIGLYGAADTVQYAPWSNRAMMVTKGKPEDAYWHQVDYERDYHCLLELTVSDVLDVIPLLMKDWGN